MTPKGRLSFFLFTVIIGFGVPMFCFFWGQNAARNEMSPQLAPLLLAHIMRFRSMCGAQTDLHETDVNVTTRYDSFLYGLSSEVERTASKLTMALDRHRTSTHANIFNDKTLETIFANVKEARKIKMSSSVEQEFDFGEVMKRIAMLPYFGLPPPTSELQQD